ncbi:MAG: hypothetical protein GEU28_07330 [Dehalococcoidia bacterium]|nr:hypothetical protein [Dehalococcoidia bacterium]
MAAGHKLNETAPAGEIAPSLTSKAERVLLIGVDGGTWDVIQPLIDKGVMPNLQRLVEGGAKGVLNSIFPPITAPAWSSIYTGTNPGKHGIYDFMRRIPGTYEVAPVDVTYRDGKSMFRLVSDAGAQAFALNAPVSFPPEEIDGAVVPGLPTPGFAIAPKSLEQAFLEAVPGYEPFPAAMAHLAGRTDALPAMATDYVTKTARSFQFLNEALPRWRLGLVHFQVTDVAEHYAWGDSATLERVHAEVDRGIGAIVDATPEGTTVIVISDHGHGSLTAYLHMNEWLRARGYLKFKRAPLSLLKTLAYRAGVTPTRVYSLIFRLGLGKRVQATVHKRRGGVRQLLRRLFVSYDDVDWPRTTAYSVGNVGQIYMNVRGREPQGAIAPGPELERETERLRGDLAALRHPETGQPIASKVVLGSEIYDGPRAAEAPDLMFVPRDYSCWAFAETQFASSHWFSKPHDARNGHHRMEGIIAVSGAGVRRADDLEASLLDVAPTVLSLLGIPQPSYFDGRIVGEAFAESPVAVAAAEGSDQIEAGSRTGYSDEDAAVVARRLDDLGYL